jgi:hypothetical protein
VRPDCARAAAAYRLVLPGSPLAGRLGDRLGKGTGSSLEFMDFRDYVPGDDLRHVDWRAYARTDQLKVRLFREEISPSLDIVLDVSPSMAVSEAKRTAVLDLAEAARYWTERAGGRPRILLGGGGVLVPGAEVSFAGPDAWLPRVPLRPRMLRMVISDFLVPEDPTPLLRRFARGASHCYVLQVLDPWEAAPEAEGERTLIDCEADARLDIVLDTATVTRYRERLGRLCETVRAAVRGVGGSYALLTAAAPGRMMREQLLPQGLVEPA